MARILHWLWNRALLYAALVGVAAFLALAWPGVPEVLRRLEGENRSQAEIAAQLQTSLADQRRQLGQRVAQAKALPSAQLNQRIRDREAALAAAEARRDAAGAGWLAAYRPSQIMARQQAGIEAAAIAAELGALKTIAEPRKRIEAADAFFARNPMMPTQEAIVQARQKCSAARADLAAFAARWPIEQGLREAIRQDRTRLENGQKTACDRAAMLEARRNAALAARRARDSASAALAAATPVALPASLIPDTGRVTLRDILIKALYWLLAITLAPFAYRILAYHVLAPIAARWPAMRFGPQGEGGAMPGSGGSAISLGIELGPDDEALVRQDYLQASSLRGAKRTRWLLDWRHPLVSFASGMRFLTAIRGTGERLTLSAVRDPFAELAVVTVPAGAACVLRPSALAAVVLTGGQTLRITSHWRLFSLPALLTWQWRYLAFHGPVQLVVKGGRGVRIEPAVRGQIIAEGQIIGFSTDLAYAVIRSETFWPYFFGREALLKDRLEAGAGIVLVEEAPLAGRSGIRRGIEGLSDALLKLVGI